MQAVRQDASEPEALKQKMTCVATQHQVAQITVEDANCCNLTSVLAIENQLKRNIEGFDCPCEDGNLQVQPAVKDNLQQQPVTEGYELESKPEQKPKQQKRKSREKRQEQKKGKKQVTIGERMDGGNAKKQRKTVVKSTRQVGKKFIRCKNTSQKPKPSWKAKKQERKSKQLKSTELKASRCMRTATDSAENRAQHRRHFMYLHQKHRQVMYNLRSLRGRGRNWRVNDR